MVVGPRRVLGIRGVCSTEKRKISFSILPRRFVEKVEKNNHKFEYFSHQISSYLTGNGKDGLSDKCDVLEVPQVVGVEEINVADAVESCSSLELLKSNSSSAKVVENCLEIVAYRDVVHHFVVTA
jgi:hypothetical protein